MGIDIYTLKQEDSSDDEEYQSPKESYLFHQFNKNKTLSSRISNIFSSKG